jgi:hypothetical protein
MSSGAKNMKTGHDAHDSAENESGSKNMKTGHDALGTAENEPGRAKHENGTCRPRYGRKRVWGRKAGKRDSTPSKPPKMSSDAQNKNTGTDAPGSAKYESGSAKREKGTRRPWNGRK